MAERRKQEVLEYLSRAEVAAVGTSNMGTPRQRMMHFGFDEDFNIYVSSMKGDPKIIQWSNIPETALLIHQGDKFLEMEECEIMSHLAPEMISKRKPGPGNRLYVLCHSQPL